MLAYHWHKNSGRPMVFLHGLLGSQQDWAEIISALLQNSPEIRPLTIDLPAHGESRSIACESFTAARQLLHQTLTSLIAEPFYLVGYSLGGRLALDYTLNAHNPMLLGSVLEGANIGLQTEEEKAARWQNDHAWATRFHNESLATVLQDWYRQPVFANLSETQRTNLIQERKHNEGKCIAQMLEATSLAKQAFMRPSKQDNITFLIGEKDSKFRMMAENHSLPYQLITNAGHNAHRENPAKFTTMLQKLCQ